MGENMQAVTLFLFTREQNAFRFSVQLRLPKLYIRNQAEIEAEIVGKIAKAEEGGTPRLAAKQNFFLLLANSLAVARELLPSSAGLKGIVELKEAQEVNIQHVERYPITPALVLRGFILHIPVY